MKICAFDHVSGIYAGGVAIIVPNCNKFAIDDFRFWSIGEAAKGPHLLGKRFPVHDVCDEPYCWDYYYHQRKPENVRREYRDQLDEMTAIMGDRPYVIMDDADLPARTWPWSTRRNAWAIDGKEVVDRRNIITKQEVSLTLAWMHEIHIDGHGEWTNRIKRIVNSDGRRYLRKGEIEPYVGEWRRSSSCWPDSRFEQPSDAKFDLCWFSGVAA